MTDPRRAGPVAGSVFTVDVAAQTDCGAVRERNEDAVWCESASSPVALVRGSLCVVADGMGGMAAGDVASQLAIDVVRSEYYGGEILEAAEALRRAIEVASRRIWEESRRQTERAGMGCTLTAAVVHGDHIVVGHVGDSRAYLVRQGVIRQVTTDHSWVAQQVACGILSPEQAQRHPQRNLILRALGQEPTVEVDICEERALAGDVLVLCSDGLTTVVGDDEIAQHVSQLQPAEATEALVKLANERGAPDNVTVAVMRVGGASPAPAMSHASSRAWVLPLIAAITMIALAAILLLSTIAMSAPWASDASTRAGESSPRPPPSPSAASPGPPSSRPEGVPLATVAPPTVTLVPVAPPTVTLAPAPTMPPSPTSTAARPAATATPPRSPTATRVQTGRVASPSGAALRAQPDKSSRNLKNLEDGTRLGILRVVPGEPPPGGETDRWYEVRVIASGRKGYVYSELVALDPS